jgi:fructose-1-phosphate kinase PfkB-like protein
LKVNAAEATALTGLAVDSAGEAAEAAQALRVRIGGDGHAAAVTLGRDGAVLVAPDGDAWHGSLAATGCYPVGSGDAFLAGLVTALADGVSWPGPLATALGTAAASAEVPGPGLLDADRARALAEHARVEPVATAEVR